MSGERVRVTYPDLAQPREGPPDDLNDPPPDYSTLPPPSLADRSDLRDATLPRTPAAPQAAPSVSPDTHHTRYTPYSGHPHYTPLRPPTLVTPITPGAPVIPATPDARSAFTPAPHIFKPSNLIPSISNETAFYFTVTGLDERTTNFVNSLLELGLAAITVIGTLFTYWWGNRKAKCEAREKEKQKNVFEEWKEWGIIPENDVFVFSVVDGNGEKEKDGKKGEKNWRDLPGLIVPPRLHARDWNLANS